MSRPSLACSVASDSGVALSPRMISRRIAGQQFEHRKHHHRRHRQRDDEGGEALQQEQGHSRTYGLRAAVAPLASGPAGAAAFYDASRLFRQGAAAMATIPFDSSGVFIGGQLARLRQRRDAAAVQPLRRHAAGADRARRGGRHRRRGGRGAGRARRPLGPADGGRARARAAAHVGPGAGAGRRAGAAGGAGRRQAAEAGPGRCRGAGALPRVLRRRGRQGDGRDHPLRQRLHRLDAARAAWRHRPHRAVELPDADHRPQLSVRRWRWATPACSSRPRKPA